MSYRDWEEDPRNRRGRHSAPEGWVASDETYAGQPRQDSGRRRGGYTEYGERADPGDYGASAPSDEQRGSLERQARSRGWSMPDRLDDTGTWAWGAHTGEWQRPDEGWPARPEPDSAPPDDDPGRGSWSAPAERSWSTDTWAGEGSPGYGRRQPNEPQTYGRRALPSADPPAPAIPTSSGAYAGELLPPGHRRDGSRPATPPAERPGYGAASDDRHYAQSSYADSAYSGSAPSEAAYRSSAYQDTGSADTWAGERPLASYRDDSTYRDDSRYRDDAGGPGAAYLGRDQPPHRRDERADTAQFSYRDEPAYRDWRAAPEEPSRHRAEPASYRDRPGWEQPADRAAPAHRQAPSYRDESPPYRDSPGQRALPALPESPAYRDRRDPFGDRAGDERGGQASYLAGAGDYRREPYGERAGTAPYRESAGRRPAALPAAPAGRRATVYDVDEDDEFDDEPEPGGYLAAMVYTVMWYAVPMVLWVLWSLTLNSEASANCVSDAGVPCASERTVALTTLTQAMPRVAGTLLLSILISAVLRWVSSSWKAATVGFAAAVVGGGLATVGISVITGQPIG